MTEDLYFARGLFIRDITTKNYWNLSEEARLDFYFDNDRLMYCKEKWWGRLQRVIEGSVWPLGLFGVYNEIDKHIWIRRHDKEFCEKYKLLIGDGKDIMR